MTSKTFDRSRLRVLFVDDVPLIGELMTAVLGSVGVNYVGRARNGQDALDMIPSFGPHIVFVDWQMTPINGIEFISAIRHSPQSPDPYLPIVMLTAFAERRRIVEALAAGAHDYLVKPFTGRLVLDRLESVLNDPRPFMKTESYFGPAPRPLAELDYAYD